MKAPNSKVQAPEKHQTSSANPVPLSDWMGEGLGVRARRLVLPWCLVLGAWCFGDCFGHAIAAPAEETLAATNRIDTQQRRGRFGAPDRGVYKTQITPHWFDKDSRFWYRNDLSAGRKEFVVVNAEKGTRAPAFDHQKLAESLSKAAGESFTSDKLPFSSLEFIQDGKAIQFEATGKTWHCDLS